MSQRSLSRLSKMSRRSLSRASKICLVLSSDVFPLAEKDLAIGTWLIYWFNFSNFVNWGILTELECNSTTRITVKYYHYYSRQQAVKVAGWRQSVSLPSKNDAQGLKRILKTNESERSLEYYYSELTWKRKVLCMSQGITWVTLLRLKWLMWLMCFFASQNH